MESQKTKYVVDAMWLAVEQAVNERNVEALTELATELSRIQLVKPTKPKQPAVVLELVQPSINIDNDNETKPNKEALNPIVDKELISNSRYHTSYVAKVIYDVLDKFKTSEYVNDDGVFLARHCVQWLIDNEIDKFFVGIKKWDKRVNYAFADHLASKVNRYYSHIEHIGYGRYQFINTNV